MPVLILNYVTLELSPWGVSMMRTENRKEHVERGSHKSSQPNRNCSAISPTGHSSVPTGIAPGQVMPWSPPALVGLTLIFHLHTDSGLGEVLLFLA